MLQHPRPTLAGDPHQAAPALQPNDKAMSNDALTSPSPANSLRPAPPSRIAALRRSEWTGRSVIRAVDGTRARLLDMVSAPTQCHVCISTAYVPVPTYAADFAPKATGTRFLAAADESGTLTVLDTDNADDALLAARFPAHRNSIFDVKWHPTNPLLATASGDHTAAIWDVETQRATALLSAHASSVRNIAFNPHDPSLLATGSRDGAIMVWDLRCAGVAMPIGDGVPADNDVPAGTAYGAANVLRHAHATNTTVVSGKSTPTSTSRSSATSAAATVSISSVLYTSEREIASAGAYDGVVRLWDVRKHGSHNHRARAVPSRVSTNLTAGRARKFGLTHMALDPARRVLYASGMTSTVYAVDADSLMPLAAFASARFTPSHYTRVAVDPAGEWVAAGSTQHTVVVWQAKRPDRAPVLLQNGHAAEVSSVVFSHSTVGFRLASCSDDATVRIWRENSLVAQDVRAATDERAEPGTTDLALKSWGCAVEEQGHVSVSVPCAEDEGEAVGRTPARTTDLKSFLAARTSSPARSASSPSLASPAPAPTSSSGAGETLTPRPLASSSSTLALTPSQSSTPTTRRKRTITDFFKSQQASPTTASPSPKSRARRTTASARQGEKGDEENAPPSSSMHSALASSPASSSSNSTPPDDESLEEQ
ncbi:hypothetical protein AMAG_04829 [Allomyces macrogynus ATCC 38327]|uniref:Uncharacterized protein n=1 Tax=Allomyces macrogynus (strain ATCC 38327) TaxID=578462 RepID=A0A0L0S6F0_ALLM3|nr:hypothetical protein AMAG_04829 [Allomyces macrogynus ATCC 38327]|eukprot:KNE58000.1 hypothetical protein AMAG_04829 [Allomyces macrogynus ATCC 38327]